MPRGSGDSDWNDDAAGNDPADWAVAFLLIAGFFWVVFCCRKEKPYEMY
jgi:hypothetical protein